jgi:hypothetical protein
MTDEEIIAIRDSLLPNRGEQFDQMAFGRAIAAAEREACAQLCEEYAMGAPDGDTDRDAILGAAEKIRERANAELTGVAKRSPG